MVEDLEREGKGIFARGREVSSIMSEKIELIGKRGHGGSALWDPEQTAAFGKGTLKVAGQVYVIMALGGKASLAAHARQIVSGPES